MDLGGLKTPFRTVAVVTTRPYAAIDIGTAAACQSPVEGARAFRAEPFPRRLHDLRDAVEL